MDKIMEINMPMGCTCANLKRTGIWILLFGKRLFRKRYFVVLCVAVPLFILLLERLYVIEKPGIRAVYCMEDSIWWEGFGEQLDAYEGQLVFYPVQTAEEAKREVQTGRADCGYILAGDVRREGIVEYRKENSRIPDLVREVLFAQVFGRITAQDYIEYMEEILPEAGTAQSEAALRKYLHNNSTFSVEYVEEGTASSDGVRRGIGFPVKNILLFYVFAAVLGGTADAVRDREEKRFIKLRHPGAAGALSIFLPFTVSMLVSLFSLWGIGEIRAAADAAFLAGGLLLLGLGLILNCCFRNSRILLSCYPFLLLGGLLLCVGNAVL